MRVLTHGHQGHGKVGADSRGDDVRSGGVCPPRVARKDERLGGHQGIVALVHGAREAGKVCNIGERNFHAFRAAGGMPQAGMSSMRHAASGGRRRFGSAMVLGRMQGRWRIYLQILSLESALETRESCSPTSFAGLRETESP